MCGIGCILDSNSICDFGKSNNKCTGISDCDIQIVIKNRGPNSLNTVTKNRCSFIGSVLHIQGPKVIDQPYINSDGDVLLWNGEVFSKNSFESGLSDTVQISKLLNKEIKSTIERKDLKYADRSELLSSAVQSVVESLSLIHGPYAFIYYSKLLEIIIYGRDPFGRRSLLKLKDNGCIIALSSVWATSSDCKDDPEISEDNVLMWEEIPVTGIFGCSVENKENINLHQFQGGLDSPEKNNLFAPWPSSRIKLGRRHIVGKISTNIKIDNTIDRFVTSSSLLLDTLINAVRCRVASMGFDLSPVISHNVASARVNLAISDQSNQIEGIHLSPHQCRVGVLFSGGIDSVVLAALLHLSLPNSDEPIDLLNVAFTGKENSIAVPDNTCETQGDEISPGIESLNDEEKVLEQPAPDRLAAVAALGELQNLFPTREWRLVHVDVTSQERQKHEEQIKNLIRPRDTHMDLNIGTALWFASRGQGYLRNYTEAEILSASATTDSAGRPLVRAGGDEFARSVGLSSWTQKNKINKISSSIDIDKGASVESKPVGEKEILKGLDLKCATVDCRLQSKSTCVRNLCKRCCNQFERATKGDLFIPPLRDSIGEVERYIGLPIPSDETSSGIINSSNSSAIESSQFGSISNFDSDGNDMVALICRVHKSSARELEKMRSNEKRIAERRQGSKLCLTCEKTNTKCKRDCPGRRDSVKSASIDDSFETMNGKNKITDERGKITKEVLTLNLGHNSKIKTIVIKCNQTIIKKAYTTTCRALLIGIGADEQMVICNTNFYFYDNVIYSFSIKSIRNLHWYMMTIDSNHLQLSDLFFII